MKLTIGNSVSRLEEYTPEQFKALRKALSYQEKSQFMWGSKRPHFVIKNLMDKYGNFPTGLVCALEEALLKHNWKITKLNDTRVRPQTTLKPSIFIGTHPDPYPEQRIAAEAALEHSRGIIVAPTGCGKTRLAAEIINKLQLPTLIVVPSLELKNQVTQAMREFFGSYKVGPIVRGKIKSFITVENVDQLEKLKAPPKVDCVIIDEFHRSGSKTYRKINLKLWNDVYYKLGLTATPYRSQEEEKILMESVLSKVIYRITYSTAVDSGYVVPMEAYYYDLPKRHLKFNKYADAYKVLVVEREDRNTLISDLIQNLHSANVSTLVLVKQIEHGIKLQEEAAKRGIDIPFAQGINDDNKSIIEAFNKSHIPVLIGTVGVLGEGIDTKPCEYVIMAGGGKSKNQFVQNVGRGFRKFKNKESCKIIMFRDSSNKWLLDHFNACKKYLEEEYSLLPTKLDHDSF